MTAGSSSTTTTKSEWESPVYNVGYRAGDKVETGRFGKVEGKDNVEQVQSDAVELARVQWSEQLWRYQQGNDF